MGWGLGGRGRGRAGPGPGTETERGVHAQPGLVRARGERAPEGDERPVRPRLKALVQGVEPRAAQRRRPPRVVNGGPARRRQ